MASISALLRKYDVIWKSLLTALGFIGVVLLVMYFTSSGGDSDSGNGSGNEQQQQQSV